MKDKLDSKFKNKLYIQMWNKLEEEVYKQINNNMSGCLNKKINNVILEPLNIQLHTRFYIQNYTNISSIFKNNEKRLDNIEDL